MRFEEGNIWDYTQNVKVVPTNLGYKRDGTNVMGAGLARQAAERYPDLPARYGRFCKAMAAINSEELFFYLDLILFPVKPLNKEQPWMSWQQDADLALIRRSTEALAGLPYRNVVVPLVGCGNGNLHEDDVLPILEDLLDDRFILIRK